VNECKPLAGGTKASAATMLSPSPFADRDCFTPALKDNTPRPHHESAAAAAGGARGGGVGGSVLPIAWGTWGTPGQGLTLVHFSAQLEPCLTQETTLHILNTP